MAEASGVESWSRSDIPRPTYASILKNQKKLESDYPQWVRRIAYGHSTKGATLQALTLAKQDRSNYPRTFLITANSHGGEYLGFEDTLPQLLARETTSAGVVRTFLEEGGALVWVSVVNPDGFENDSRLNSRGKDLNRDWLSQEELETRNLRKLLDRLQRPSGTFRFIGAVDYHCCAGAVLIPDGSGRDVTYLSMANLARDHLSVRRGSTEGILGYQAPGTLKNFLFGEWGIPALTFEGRSVVEVDYTPQHLAWWKSLMVKSAFF